MSQVFSNKQVLTECFSSMPKRETDKEIMVNCVVSGEGLNWGEQRMLWGHREGILLMDIRLQVKEVKLQVYLERGPHQGEGGACAKNTHWVIHT